MEWLYQYSLFLAKCATVVFAFVFVVAFSMMQKKKSGDNDNIIVKDLNEKYEEVEETLSSKLLSEAEYKEKAKEKKALLKKLKKEKTPNAKPILYVLSFKGSSDAHEVENLRKEISALLSVIRTEDEVLLRLESPGGIVPGYGLAASQLMRLRDKQIPLTIAVDKVAASGGYMMACVASKIIAAPFAIIGSIGVVAQLPNIYRLLKKNDVDVELHTAGKYKRTLTMLGENTEEGREKFQQELEETHLLFKDFVLAQRPKLDIESVATGEYWYGTIAKEKGLIDEIGTSDDFIFERLKTNKVLAISSMNKTNWMSKISKGLLKVFNRFSF